MLTRSLYSVKAWEEYSWHGGRPENYWASGITLREFNEAVEAGLVDEREWEVLLPPEAAEGARRVSKRRLLEAVEAGSLEDHDLARYLQRARVK